MCSECTDDFRVLEFSVRLRNQGYLLISTLPLITSEIARYLDISKVDLPLDFQEKNDASNVIAVYFT